MSKLSLMLCVLAAVGISVLFFVFGFRAAPKTYGESSKLAHNKFVHRLEDPEKAVEELESAWQRFQAAKGSTIRTDGKPHGLTDQQIDDFERKLRQRFLADLRAFLKIYLSHGRFLNDLEFFAPDQLYPRWLSRTRLGFDWGNTIRFGPPHDGDPWFTEHCVFNFASEHLEDIGYDLRNGKIIEVMDCDSGWMANSLAELFNEMAIHYEKGKIISRYDWEIEERPDAEQLRDKLLDSVMWHVYKRPTNEDAQ